MSTKAKFLDVNKENYQNLYAKEEAFLLYPADWVIRFHNMYMKKNVPSGRILDYGFGTGSNSTFFMQKGYETHGIDVAPESIQLLKKNFQLKHIDENLADNFKIVSPESQTLEYDDNYFDFIISNQVLYYLASENSIRNVTKEMKRCLRPGGLVFFTMMGPRNYYMTEKTVNVHDGKVHEIIIDDSKHRLQGLKEYIYLVKTREELIDLFSEFECVTTGHFEISMFDISSNFHWIYAGIKR